VRSRTECLTIWFSVSAGSGSVNVDTGTRDSLSRRLSVRGWFVDGAGAGDPLLVRQILKDLLAERPSLRVPRDVSLISLAGGRLRYGCISALMISASRPR
jgi:hypothetical protein